MAVMEATMTATQIPTIVHGRRAETRARFSVDRIDNAILGSSSISATARAHSLMRRRDDLQIDL